MMAALHGNFLRFILTILTESPLNCHFYSAVSHLILQFTFLKWWGKSDFFSDSKSYKCFTIFILLRIDVELWRFETMRDREHNYRGVINL